jgi:twitching motility protein PilU
MVPATEVLLNTPVVRDKIRDGGDEDIPAIINSSIPDGMRSFTYSLADLVRKEHVAVQTAMAFAPNQNALDSALKGVEVKAQSLVHRVKRAT